MGLLSSGSRAGGCAASAVDVSLPPMLTLKLNRPFESVQVSPWALPLQTLWMRTGSGGIDPPSSATSPEKKIARSLVCMSGGIWPLARTPAANIMAAITDVWRSTTPPGSTCLIMHPPAAFVAALVRVWIPWTNDADVVVGKHAVAPRQFHFRHVATDAFALRHRTGFLKRLGRR